MGARDGVALQPRSRRWIWITIGVAVLLVAAIVARNLADDGFESVEDFVAELESHGVKCELGVVTTPTDTSIMESPVNYESGTCRMPGEPPLRITVFESAEQASLSRQESAGSTGGSWFLSGDNWEVLAKSLASAERVRRVMGGDYSSL